jgi:hypothetical protein
LNQLYSENSHCWKRIKNAKTWPQQL